MNTKNSTDFNQRMKLQNKDIKVDLDSLRAMLEAEKANIALLTPEMMSAYQSQSHYAKLLGKQITLSENRIDKLKKLIWKHECKRKIVGRMIQQTNSRKYRGDELLNYLWVALEKQTFVPCKRIENIILERMKNHFKNTRV